MLNRVFYKLFLILARKATKFINPKGKRSTGAPRDDNRANAVEHRPAEND